MSAIAHPRSPVPIRELRHPSTITRPSSQDDESDSILLRTQRTLVTSLAMTALLLLPFCPRVFSQEETRASSIESARQEKAKNLTPEELSGGEAVLKKFRDKKVLERFSTGYSGFRIKLGGLVSGSGFALGPEYLRSGLASGNVLFRTSGQSSFKAYQRFDLQIATPEPESSKVFFDFFAVRHNFPGIAYYGPGPNSLKADRTNYRFEDTATDFTLGFHPLRNLAVGASTGYLWVNVGPGGDSRYASSDIIFSPVQAPGIDQQTDFYRYGFFATYDYRDEPLGPRGGGYYSVRFNRYLDQNFGAYSFHRFDLDLRQFIPLFNRRRVIALRAKTVLTDPTGNNAVPFYLQPTVGGSDDLRGFRQFRFRDNNMLVLNGEWRWEVFSGLDMAGFYDAGKVFPRRSQLNFHGLYSSAGFGFRFNVLGMVFLRVDVGFSKEGTQVWFKFDNVFLEERVRSTPYQ